MAYLEGLGCPVADRAGHGGLRFQVSQCGGPKILRCSGCEHEGTLQRLANANVSVYANMSD